MHSVHIEKQVVEIASATLMKQSLPMIRQIFSSNPHPTSPDPDPKADAVTSWIEVLNKAPWLMCLALGSDHTVQDHELRPRDELTVLQKAIF